MGLECPATFHLIDESIVHQAVAVDLSAVGLQLNTVDAMVLGGVVMVEVTPEAAVVPPLQVRAEVVRCDKSSSEGYHLGLKILEMLPGL